MTLENSDTVVPVGEEIRHSMYYLEIQKIRYEDKFDVVWNCLLYTSFLYEVFSPEDYQRFEDQYVTVRYDWALEEFGKIGMEKAVDRHLSAEPKVTGVWKKDSRLLIQMSMPKEAVERFGAPARLELLMTFSPRSITFDLAWFQKSASPVSYTHLDVYKRQG